MLKRPAASLDELWFEVEQRCNLRCRFCYNPWRGGASPTPADLSADEAAAALERVLDGWPCRKVVFSGGEPLLRPDLERLVAIAKRRGCACVVTTNGRLLTLDRARSLQDAGVDLVQAPILSAEAATHDALSGAACFTEVIENLVALRALALPVVPVFVATRRNLGGLVAVLRLCYLLQCRTVIVNKFIPGGLGLRHAGELAVTDDELREALMEADRFAHAHGMRIALGAPVDLGGAFGALRATSASSCPVAAGAGKLTVDPAGDVKQCTHTTVTLGNVARESVAEIVRHFEALQDAMPLRGGFRDCRFACGKGEFAYGSGGERRQSSL